MILLIWSIHAFYEATTGPKLVLEDTFGVFERACVEVWLLKIHILVLLKRVITRISHRRPSNPTRPVGQRQVEKL